MKEAFLECVIVMLAFLGCNTQQGASPDALADTLDNGESEIGQGRCGNGACERKAGENCLSCPEDCACACGDGVCSFGEYCATCPKDCLCAIPPKTPPMGFNTWNHFHCDVSEALIREVATAMVEKGLKDLGYYYVVIDDCWQVARDEDGTIVPDPEGFPSGIKALAEYVHKMGLYFGIYTCAGEKTCQGRPGSFGYEEKDTETYANFGVDFVKVDWCYTEGLDPKERYRIFADAIAKSGRNMVLSICNWGVQEPWVWGPYTGTMWRTSMDITDSFISVLFNMEQALLWGGFSGEGHFNDPDMLEVGNGGMSFDEYVAHMSLWAMLASPLILGNDVREMDDETMTIIGNEEVIAIDQDPWVLQGVRVPASESGQIFYRPLAEYGARAVLLLNISDQESVFGFSLEDIGLRNAGARVRDVWSHEEVSGEEGGAGGEGLSFRVPAHGARMFVVRGEEELPPSGESYLSDIRWMFSVGSLGPVERDMSNGGSEKGDGQKLKMRGKVYEKGIGMLASGRVLVYLGGKCQRLQVFVGLDDSAKGEGSVVFRIKADGRLLFQSPLLTLKDEPLEVNADLTGARALWLEADAGGDTYHDDFADFAMARLECE